MLVMRAMNSGSSIEPRSLILASFTKSLLEDFAKVPPNLTLSPSDKFDE